LFAHGDTIANSAVWLLTFTFIGYLSQIEESIVAILPIPQKCILKAGKYAARELERTTVWLSDVTLRGGLPDQ
jgi:carbon starvation protein CstA